MTSEALDPAMLEGWRLFGSKATKSRNPPPPPPSGSSWPGLGGSIYQSQQTSRVTHISPFWIVRHLFFPLQPSGKNHTFQARREVKNQTRSVPVAGVGGGVGVGRRRSPRRTESESCGSPLPPALPGRQLPVPSSDNRRRGSHCASILNMLPKGTSTSRHCRDILVPPPLRVLAGAEAASSPAPRRVRFQWGTLASRCQRPH